MQSEFENYGNERARRIFGALVIVNENPATIAGFSLTKLDRFEPKLAAMAASCRPCTNFELSIKNFIGCLTCFTLEIICDIINQNKPVEKGVALWQSI